MELQQIQEIGWRSTSRFQGMVIAKESIQQAEGAVVDPTKEPKVRKSKYSPSGQYPSVIAIGV